MVLIVGSINSIFKVLGQKEEGWEEIGVRWFCREFVIVRRSIVGLLEFIFFFRGLVFVFLFLLIRAFRVRICVELYLFWFYSQEYIQESGGSAFISGISVVEFYFILWDVYFNNINSLENLVKIKFFYWIWKYSFFIYCVINRFESRVFLLVCRWVVEFFLDGVFEVYLGSEKLSVFLDVVFGRKFLGGFFGLQSVGFGWFCYFRRLC